MVIDCGNQKENEELSLLFRFGRKGLGVNKRGGKKYDWVSQGQGSINWSA